MHLIDEHSKGFLYTFSKKNFSLTSTKKANVKEIIKVIIADDHPHLICGVEADLNKDSNIKIIGRSTSFMEVVELNKKIKADIILLDLKMPGSDKKSLKEVIADLTRSSKVIVFTNETGWARIHKILELGASAYIEKAIAFGRLSEFIRHVYACNDLLIFSAEKMPKIQFSKRQTEILNLMVDGIENDQISETLKIELKTVQSYLTEIKIKLSDAFGIHPIRPRTLVLLAAKLGYGQVN